MLPHKDEVILNVLEPARLVVMNQSPPDLSEDSLSSRLPVDRGPEQRNLALDHRNSRDWLRRGVLCVRDCLLEVRLWFVRKVMKMDIHPTVKISLKANLDLTNPTGVHIDEGTYISFHAVILAHDMSRLLMTDTYIGKNCFIGAYSIIMPGVRVGDECIVGSGSVVTSDVSSYSIVAGNPAKVIRSGIRTRQWGILEDAYAKAVATESEAQPQRVPGH
jgi:acetyltransferase-like isoleucine patch superfamily enzyme